MEDRSINFSDFWLNIILNSEKCFITKGGREKFFYYHQPFLKHWSKKNKNYFKPQEEEGFYIIADHKNLKNYDFITKTIIERAFLLKDEFTPKAFFSVTKDYYPDLEMAKKISGDDFPYIYAIIMDKRINNLQKPKHIFSRRFLGFKK